MIIRDMRSECVKEHIWKHIWKAAHDCYSKMLSVVPTGDTFVLIMQLGVVSTYKKRGTRKMFYIVHAVKMRPFELGGCWGSTMFVTSVHWGQTLLNH